MLLVASVASLASAAPAPGPSTPDGSRLLTVRPIGGHQFEVVAYSAAMGRPILLWVSHPDTAAPTLYLLNAVDGGETGGAWTGRTDVASFFAGKNVNVVLPMSGRASYYTDWERDDPVLGRNKWATFLTRELPPLIDSAFHTTGRDAVAGVSMSATSALDLAIHAPGRYQAVASYSGCARTSDPAARAYVYSQLGVFGADATNMWGPVGDPNWADHDPTMHADRLRGVRLYISAGAGLPGLHESITAPEVGGNVGVLGDRIIVGGVMEAVVDQCTRLLADRLRALGIPATVDLPATGTHAWPYWQDELHNSWPVLAAAIGATG